MPDSPQRATPLPADYPVLLFEDPGAWARWLEENGDSARGVWLRMAKKGTTLTTLSISEALDEALCNGWIDGQRRRFDEVSYIQKFTPRGKRSIWSRINRDRVEQLTEEGRMRPGGQAAVDAARSDGRWDRAYEPASRATVPPDLQSALDASPAADVFFRTLNRTGRYAVIYRVQTAVKPETRARRIRVLVEMLERGETISP